MTFDVLTFDAVSTHSLCIFQPFMSKRKSLLLPALLGLLAFGLILLALWPEPEPTVDIVVAARDLGAGAALTPADLALRTLPADQAPSDAASDPAALVGHTLAVARFQGEPISPKHLGPGVNLGPDERAVAVRVQRDRGLAGLRMPSPSPCVRPPAPWGTSFSRPYPRPPPPLAPPSPPASGASGRFGFGASAPSSHQYSVSQSSVPGQKVLRRHAPNARQTVEMFVKGHNLMNVTMIHMDADQCVDKIDVQIGKKR